jgi:hydroxymethylglutaryl-CoA lyase
MLADPSAVIRNVVLQEVGPRDGLQNEPVVLAPALRARIIEALAEAGLRRIQIGSFVNPTLVPQMAGTDQVWRLLRKRPDTRYSALVLSQRGLHQAISVRVPHVEIYVSVSETHSLKNVGMTVERALAEAGAMIHSAMSAGLSVTAGVMCAFGCFYEGAIPIGKVVDLIVALDHAPDMEIGLADTTGMGDPELVRQAISALAGKVEPDRITLHLHDTRGLGLANVRAALDMGVRRFDTAVGGLGGCPFVPGAAGNIATELTVEMMETLGFSTGVDAAKIDGVRAMLAKHLSISLPRA